MMRKILCSLLLIFCSMSAVYAVEDEYHFDSSEKERAFNELIAELRCPQCQNNNIADANATISNDMHGNFVTYKPPLTVDTVIMWLAPMLSRDAQMERTTDLEPTLIGKPLPNFTIEALEEGKTYQRSDLINGKPFLLVVWATWNPIFYEEHHYLNELASQGIRLIGVDYKDDRQKALNWLAQNKNPFAINLADHNGLAGLDLGVYGTTETFLVDGQGIIRYKLVGPIHEQVWENEMLPIWQRYAGDKP